MVYNVKTLIDNLKQHGKTKLYIWNIQKLNRTPETQLCFNTKYELLNEDRSVMTSDQIIDFMDNYEYTDDDIEILLKAYVKYKYKMISYMNDIIVRDFIESINIDVVFKNCPFSMIIKAFDLYDMFTLEELIKYKVHQYVIDKIKDNIMCISNMKSLSKLYISQIEDAETILINILLAPNTISKYKINKLLKAIFNVHGYVIYNIVIDNTTNNCILSKDIIDAILNKYVTDDNAINTLCSGSRNGHMIFHYAKTSKRVYKLSEINIKSILGKLIVPPWIVGKIKYNPSFTYSLFNQLHCDRLDIDIHTIMWHIKNLPLELFYSYPKWLKYYIHFHGTIKNDQINTIIDIYNNTNIHLTDDILFEIIGKSSYGIYKALQSIIIIITHMN
jgi:hypothetical protein